MNRKIKIGLIGYGYWGPNYARILSGLPECELACICDLDPKILEKASLEFPNVINTSNYKELLEDKKLDALIVATPTTTHASLAKEVLENSKHLLIEKPLTLRSDEALSLSEMAKKNNLILMAGQTYIFNPSVNYLREEINKNTFGNPLYFISERLNLGPIRSDVNVIWDLAPHDISTILYLMNSKPVAINTSGMGFLNALNEDVATIVVKFENDVLATILVSWLAPSKIRRLTMVGDKKMFVFDDTDSEYPVKIMDKSVWQLEKGKTVEFSQYRNISLNHGGTLSPVIQRAEPLKEEILNFIKSITGEESPKVTSKHAYMVVKVLEAANESMKTGKLVSIE